MSAWLSDSPACVSALPIFTAHIHICKNLVFPHTLSFPTFFLGTGVPSADAFHLDFRVFLSPATSWLSAGSVACSTGMFAAGDGAGGGLICAFAAEAATAADTKCMRPGLMKPLMVFRVTGPSDAEPASVPLIGKNSTAQRARLTNLTILFGKNWVFRIFSDHKLNVFCL